MVPKKCFFEKSVFLSGPALSAPVALFFCFVFFSFFLTHKVKMHPPPTAYLVSEGGHQVGGSPDYQFCPLREQSLFHFTNSRWFGPPFRTTGLLGLQESPILTFASSIGSIRLCLVNHNRTPTSATSKTKKGHKGPLGHQNQVWSMAPRVPTDTHQNPLGRGCFLFLPSSRMDIIIWGFQDVTGVSLRVFRVRTSARVFGVRTSARVFRVRTSAHADVRASNAKNCGNLKVRRGLAR